MKNLTLFPFFAILFLCKFSLHAIEVDSIQVINPQTADNICFVKVVQQNNSNILYAITKDDNDYETPSIIYKITGETVEKVHSVKGSINDIAIINNVIYYIEHNTIQGYNTKTGDTTERIVPDLPHFGRGLANIGDSVLAYIDNEWEQVYFFDIETHIETIVPINDAFVLSPICYNEFNNQIIVGDKDRTIFSLEYPSMTVKGKRYLDDWFYNLQHASFKSFVADNSGNIYVTKADTNGIYYLDTAYRIHNLSDYPKRPGKLFYNDAENCLITTDLIDSSIYKIFLNGNCNSTNISTKSAEKSCYFQIYPNPSYNSVNLVLLSEELLNNEFFISNSSGLILKQGKLINKTLQFKDLEEGIYFLNINIEEKRYSKSFIIY